MEMSGPLYPRDAQPGDNGAFALRRSRQPLFPDGGCRVLTERPVSLGAIFKKKQESLQDKKMDLSRIGEGGTSYERTKAKKKKKKGNLFICDKVSRPGSPTGHPASVLLPLSN